MLATCVEGSSKPLPVARPGKNEMQLLSLMGAFTRPRARKTNEIEPARVDLEAAPSRRHTQRWAARSSHRHRLWFRNEQRRAPQSGTWKDCASVPANAKPGGLPALRAQLTETSEEKPDVRAGLQLASMLHLNPSATVVVREF